MYILIGPESDSASQAVSPDEAKSNLVEAVNNF